MAKGIEFNVKQAIGSTLSWPHTLIRDSHNQLTNERRRRGRRCNRHKKKSPYPAVVVQDKGCKKRWLGGVSTLMKVKQTYIGSKSSNLSTSL